MRQEAHAFVRDRYADGTTDPVGSNSGIFGATKSDLRPSRQEVFEVSSRVSTFFELAAVGAVEEDELIDK